MKQQQPISFYLDPVIWEGWGGVGVQQLEPLTELRALTSMQLPPRTVSFIMKGVKQSPHTAHTVQAHTHTHTVRSHVPRVTNDKHQSGRRGTLAHSFFLKSPCRFSPPPPPLHHLLVCTLSGMRPELVRTFNITYGDPSSTERVCDSWLGCTHPAQSLLQDLIFFFFPPPLLPGTTGSCVLGFSDSVHLPASMWSECIRRRGSGVGERGEGGHMPLSAV